MSDLIYSYMDSFERPLTNVASHRVDDPPKVFRQEETDRLIKRLEAMTTGGGASLFRVYNYWQGELRWARNRASMTSDRRNTAITVNRILNNGGGSASTNQLDEASLRATIESAERRARKAANRNPVDMAFDLPTLTAMDTTTWSDATLSRSTQERATFVRAVTEQAESKGLVSSGYLESRGFAIGTLWIDQYQRHESFYGQGTQAQCSATVRHPQGTSSGWAGASNYNINEIDEEAIARRALDKCVASLNPVRIEPGRYTTILEPQAVADLIDVLMPALVRRPAENVNPLSLPGKSGNAFFLGYDAGVSRDRTKIGQRMIDERITISHNPSDPSLGILPLNDINPIVWFKDGVLQTMTYDRGYALNELNENQSAAARRAYRMSGGTTSVEEMIASTKRGVLVTRLTSIQTVDYGSLLATGLTRDGLWLIENGKISKAVRNFRFTESPLFVLNNVVDLGVPIPVFRPASLDALEISRVNTLTPAIVPPLKVNDFSFTSTVDAI